MTTVPLGHSISNPIFAGLAIEEDSLLDEDLKFELGVIYFRNVNLGKELKMKKIYIY